MILARRIPRAEQERRWKAHYAERAASALRKHENRVKGAGLVLRLDEGRRLEFRGRHYGVPPVPWPVALHILEVQQRFAALSSSETPTIKEWRETYRAIAALFKKVCRPTSRIRRVLWFLTPSPINSASPHEVGMALGFFCMFLALDPGVNQVGPSPPGTSPTTSSALPPVSPVTANGAGRGVRRDPSRGRRS